MAYSCVEIKFQHLESTIWGVEQFFLVISSGFSGPVATVTPAAPEVVRSAKFLFNIID
jgi:hypothetical protein